MLRKFGLGKIFPGKTVLVLLLALALLVTGCVVITNKNSVGCTIQLFWIGSLDCYGASIANGGTRQCTFVAEGTYAWYIPKSSCCGAGNGQMAIHDGWLYTFTCGLDGRLQMVPSSQAGEDSAAIVVRVVGQ